MKFEFYSRVEAKETVVKPQINGRVRLFGGPANLEHNLCLKEELRIENCLMPGLRIVNQP
jgi:hypothetical protein